MMTLVFLLEEPSAEAMLKGLLPNVLPSGLAVEYKIYEGKYDLDANLPRVLRTWKRPDSFFVVLRDQDASDCRKLKKNLLELCGRTGSPNVLIRIACRELESFYLGDLNAVEKGLDIRGLGAMQQKRKFRNPDQIVKPSLELFKLTKGRYQKVSGSVAIGKHLQPQHNHSKSFNVLIAGLNRISGDARETAGKS
ncbi:DUF4276 family protein [Desulfonatronum parangueonense]